jgi:hypothetical protein
MTSHSYTIKKPYTNVLIQKQEKINKETLQYIIKNHESVLYSINNDNIKGELLKSNYNILTYLKKINTKCRNNTLNTIYKQALSSQNTGRFFVDQGIGMQMILKEIRDTLTYEYYEDLDFENCHPTLLLQLCKKNKWQCDALKYYNENRDICLDELKNLVNITLKQAKMMVLKLINGGDLFLNNIILNEGQLEWLLNLSNEMVCIHSLILRNYPDYKNIAEKKKGNRKATTTAMTIYNIEGSTLNTILCDIENQCMQALHWYLFNKGLFPDILCFDGIMVRKSELIGDELLTCASNKIYEMTDFKLNIKIKELKPLFSIEELKNKKLEELKTTNENILLYSEKKKEMEKTHFKVKNPISFYNHDPKDGLIHYLRKDIKDVMENEFCLEEIKNEIGAVVGYEKKKFTELWFADPNIRTYRKIDFVPPPVICDDDVYNLWNGFEVEKLPFVENVDYENNKVINDFIDYHNTLFNNKTDVVNYMLDTYAFIIQKPGLKTNVCIWIQGDYGDGKSTIYVFFTELCGMNYIYKTSSLERGLFSQFSQAGNGKILNFFEEIEHSDGKKCYNRLKDTITQNFVGVEEKFKNSVAIRDCRKFFGFTNDRNPIPLEHDKERRHVVFESCDACQMKGDEYFKNMYSNFKGEPLRILFQYLQQRDISNFRPTKYPKTEFREELIERNQSIYTRFLIWYGEYMEERRIQHEGKLSLLGNRVSTANIKERVERDMEAEDHNTFEVKSVYLYAKFSDFIKEMHYKTEFVTSLPSFSMNLKNTIKREKLEGFEKAMEKGKRSYYIDREKFIMSLKDKEFI